MGGAVEIVETIGRDVIVHLRCSEDMIIAKLGAQRIPRFGVQSAFSRLRLADRRTSAR